jgi:hypothetical protein
MWKTMSVKECNTPQEWANGYTAEVCDTTYRDNPVIDFDIVALSGTHFFLNHSESHTEKVGAKGSGNLPTKEMI